MEGMPSTSEGVGPHRPITITKKELVARIAEMTGQTKVVAKEIIQSFLDEIIEELGRGNRLEFREFGVFEIQERAARKALNPRTRERVGVPARHVVKFKVGRLMKERVAHIPEGPATPPPPFERQGGGPSSVSPPGAGDPRTGPAR